MADHEATGVAITEFSQAVARYQGALKRLDEFRKVIDRITAARLPIKEWKVSTDPDPRREGGILCGDGKEIMPHMWPTFDQLQATLRERDGSAAARDTALARLKQLGLNPDDWK